MENIFKTSVETPIGYLEITTNRDYLLSIEFSGTFNQPSHYLPDILKESVISKDYEKNLISICNQTEQIFKLKFGNRLKKYLLVKLFLTSKLPGKPVRKTIHVQWV